MPRGKRRGMSPAPEPHGASPLTNRRQGRRSGGHAGPAEAADNTDNTDTTRRAASGSEEQDTPFPGRWRALAVCLVGGFMTLLDVSIVNVALPSIRTGLDATASDLQWVLSGYALTFGLVLVPAGRLGDARGRRGLFMAGLALFTLTSAGAGLSPGPSWLVVARLVQGIAGGVLNPQIAGIIQQLFRGRERGRAFGMLGATIGVSTAVGPLLGGLLIAAGGHREGWRWVFYVNVPVGIAALVLAHRLIPARRRAPGSTRTRPRAADLDPVGTLLLGAAVVLVLLPLVEQEQWHSGISYLLIPAGLAVAAAFVRWELRHRREHQPLVDLGLFRLRSYALGAVIALLYFAGFTAIFFIFTLYLQSGLHYSALLAGLAITPFAAGSAIAAAVGGRVVTRLGRPLVALGLLLVAVGLAGTLLAVHEVPGRGVAWVTVAPLALAGLGSGLVISPNQTLTLSEVPPDRGGAAAGVLQTGQRIGSAVGIAVIGSVFFAELGPTAASAADAFERGLAVAIGVVALTLVAALADVLAGRRRHRVSGE